METGDEVSCAFSFKSSGEYYWMVPAAYFLGQRDCRNRDESSHHWPYVASGIDQSGYVSGGNHHPHLYDTSHHWYLDF